MNEHLGAKLTPSEPLQRLVGNLMLTGDVKPGAISERGGFSRQEILDAVHGYIVAERTDPWHAEQRNRGSPRPLVWALNHLERFARFAVLGEEKWDEWCRNERERLDRKRRADKAFGARSAG